MIKFGFHIINQQQLYASCEVYSCCRFTRPQGFTYCIAANSAFANSFYPKFLVFSMFFYTFAGYIYAMVTIFDSEIAIINQKPALK